MITASALYFAVVFGAGTMLRAAQLRNLIRLAGGIYPILLILFAAMPLPVDGRQGRLAP